MSTTRESTPVEIIVHTLSAFSIGMSSTIVVKHSSVYKATPPSKSCLSALVSLQPGIAQRLSGPDVSAQVSWTAMTDSSFGGSEHERVKVSHSSILLNKQCTLVLRTFKLFNLIWTQYFACFL